MKANNPAAARIVAARARARARGEARRSVAPGSAKPAATSRAAQRSAACLPGKVQSSAIPRFAPQTLSRATRCLQSS